MVDFINFFTMPPTLPGEALHRLRHACKRAMRDACAAELPGSHVCVMKTICHLP